MWVGNGDLDVTYFSAMPLYVNYISWSAPADLSFSKGLNHYKRCNFHNLQILRKKMASNSSAC